MLWFLLSLMRSHKTVDEALCLIRQALDQATKFAAHPSQIVPGAFRLAPIHNGG